MSIIANNLLQGDEGYNISRSLRFRSSASAYLNRTPSSTGNRRTWTWSGWVKRGKLGAFSDLYTANDGSGGSDLDSFEFNSSDVIRIYFQGAVSAYLVTTQVFRDPSAWYHIVLAVDTTQATSSNRIKLYVNGVQVTSFSTATYPSQNYDTYFNLSGRSTVIGASAQTSPSGFFDGYQAEINFIDGQQLTPSSFGSTNALTGVWQPAKYTGTYGTNGFYLPFTNTTSTSTLGNDFSGNSNTWTVNNISLTAGTSYDSMTDVPTLTSATTANYCVLNPLDYENSTFTLSNANLTFAGARTASGSYYTRSTVAVTSGKWYWEVTPTNVGAGPNLVVGIQSLPSALTGGGSLTLNGYAYGADGLKWNNGGTASYGATWTNGDVIGIAYDATAGTITFYKNNTSQGTAFTGITAGTYTPIIEMSTGGVARTVAGSVNFGQQGFTYTPPTGFVALNTFNLPTSTIVKGNTVMDAVTRNGFGSSGGAITSLNFKPDFIWEKTRSSVSDNNLADSVRGSTKLLASNTTSAEATNTTYITGFTSNGYTFGTGDYGTSTTLVDWVWQAGQGTNTTNTAGSITSTVSANPTAGFSVVTYTTPASGAFTVGHGLGVAPSFIINRIRTIANNWYCYHVSLGNNTEIVLNTTTAAVSAGGDWNSTSPTSSVFSMGTGWAGSYSMISYCWSEVAGFSKFGSYTGNGSADGSFVYLGFRPRFVMIKRSDAGAVNWYIFDTARDTYNAAGLELYPNLSNAEADGRPDLDILSNGFKIRSTSGGQNTSGATYIYACFAESPFKYSLGR